MMSFFFWTSWATTTNRPDSEISYTSNWPSEPLVGNVPTTSTTTSTEEKKPPPSEGGSDDKKPAPIDNGDNPY